MIWRKVPNLPNTWASNTGQIKSVKGVMRQQTLPPGYKRVCMRHNKKKRSYYVHHLVLWAFVGPRPQGMECCHYDGDRGNNRVENIRWDTKKNNHADRRRHGTILAGESSPRSRLKEEDVRLVFILHEMGLKAKDIGVEFGVSPSHVSRILTGMSWRNISFDYEVRQCN